MKLKLVREIGSDTATLGKLYVDGVFECHTLEDSDRKLESGGVKVYGKTCIPRGTYQVVVTPSARFKRNLPLLLNVTQFEGVRIHTGNTSENTDGCILVGSSVVNADFIKDSQTAFNKLFPKICAALEDLTSVELEIV